MREGWRGATKEALGSFLNIESPPAHLNGYMRAIIAWTVFERLESEEDTNSTRRSIRIADTTSITASFAGQGRSK